MFEITILGSSAALPTSLRNSTAQVLNIHERFFLIDCAEGTQMQLRKYKAKLSRLDHIFISHLHGDHFFGLPGLISTLNLIGRKNTIHIYSPPGLQEIMHSLLFHFKDITFKIVFHVLEAPTPQIIFENKTITVTAFPLNHRLPCMGFLFKEKEKPKNINKNFIEYHRPGVKQIVDIKFGADFTTPEGEIIPNSHITTYPTPPRSYAFCSDTSFVKENIKIVEGVDLLYHEATFLNDNLKTAYKTGHSTAEQAATFAKYANVKKLIIGHFSARYTNTQDFEDAAKKIFPQTTAVRDGDKFVIE